MSREKNWCLFAMELFYRNIKIIHQFKAWEFSLNWQFLFRLDSHYFHKLNLIAWMDQRINYSKKGPPGKLSDKVWIYKVFALMKIVKYILANFGPAKSLETLMFWNKFIRLSALFAKRWVKKLQIWGSLWRNARAKAW